jgi:hypothetical protein
MKLPGSRASCFEALDRPAIKPLPPTRYELVQFKRCRVNLDYHVEIEASFYSARKHSNARLEAACERSACDRRPPLQVGGFHPQSKARVGALASDDQRVDRAHACACARSDYYH